jgi:adenylate kinase
MRLLFVGPPGAGKGTQAALVSDEYGIPQVSTGDIFRANVADATELGVLAKGYMDAGDYVPDELTNAMVKTRLAEPDAQRGFLLDGFPRTADQVEALDTILGQLGVSLDAVLCLEVDSEELIARLVKRAETSGRSDDTEDVIRRRQEIYLEQTAPLIEVYSARGLLRKIDGMGSIEEIRDRIGTVLQAVGVD